VTNPGAGSGPRALDVLFVCTANISRSPFAEHAARAILARNGQRVRVASAGTHGWDAHPVDVDMAGQLAARDLDHSDFRSRRLLGDHVQRADLVLTMEAAQRAYVLQEWPAAIRRVYTLGQLARALRSADDTLTGQDLLTELRRAQPTARPEDDVVDPYGRGAAAAATAAHQIEELLVRIVPMLSRLSVS
jgi:sulfate adenylyltransferase